MIKLNNVTLLQLNCVDPDIGVKSLKYSSRYIQFSKMILISHEKPYNLTDDIEFHQIKKLNHIGTSHFHFKELPKYIDTDFYLSIQTDGFVTNPELWSDEFLLYDYIGAPWPSLHWNSKNRVGNGGFRLESKRLLDLCSNLAWNGQPDDVMITNTYKEYFESNGCKFAPIDVAARFSMEHPISDVEYDLSKCFGFHGKLTDQSRMYVEFIKNYEF